MVLDETWGVLGGSRWFLRFLGFLVVLSGSWLLFVVLCCSWWFLMKLGSWLLFVVLDCFLWFFVVLGGSWGSWWFLVVFGGLELLFVVLCGSLWLLVSSWLLVSLFLCGFWWYIFFFFLFIYFFFYLVILSFLWLFLESMVEGPAWHFLLFFLRNQESCSIFSWSISLL